MAGLRLGPLLRYVDWETGSRATVWVEASRPCTAEVRCADGAAGTSPTFAIEGHHYALVVVTGLTAGSTTPYEVLLDGRRVWPPEDSRFPPSTITTPAVPRPDEAGPVRVAFGSCRWAAPPAHGHDAIGPDALDTLAVRLAADPEAVRPDVLLLLGDQVYADETSQATRKRLATRRDLKEAPGAEVADYEEYTHLYDESWRDPDVRWLLSTVPSCMIFDDHDVVDDWNTSEAWVRDMRDTPGGTSGSSAGSCRTGSTSTWATSPPTPWRPIPSTRPYAAYRTARRPCAATRRPPTPTPPGPGGATGVFSAEYGC